MMMKRRQRRHQQWTLMSCCSSVTTISVSALIIVFIQLSMQLSMQSWEQHIIDADKDRDDDVMCSACVLRDCTCSCQSILFSITSALLTLQRSFTVGNSLSVVLLLHHKRVFRVKRSKRGIRGRTTNYFTPSFTRLFLWWCSWWWWSSSSSQSFLWSFMAFMFIHFASLTNFTSSLRSQSRFKLFSCAAAWEAVLLLLQRKEKLNLVWNVKNDIN